MLISFVLKWHLNGINLLCLNLDGNVKNDIALLETYHDILRFNPFLMTLNDDFELVGASLLPFQKFYPRNS